MVQSVYSRFAEGVQISGVAMNIHQKGRIVYVCNSTTLSQTGVAGTAGSQGKTPDNPCNSIANALLLCVAGRGDKIILLPGHSETVSAAGGLALNVAGVSIIADPTAVGSQRPTITLDTANTSTVTITANEVVLSGILFIANFLAIATCIDITTATDVVISQCEFRDKSSVLSFVKCVRTDSTANHADGLTVSNSRFLGVGTTAATSFIQCQANINRLTVKANTVDIQGTTATTGALVLATAKALTGAQILGNDVTSPLTTSAAGCLIVAGTGGSGFVCDNYVNVPAAATAILDTASSGLGHFNNLVSRSAVDTSGLLLPAVST